MNPTILNSLSIILLAVSLMLTNQTLSTPQWSKTQRIAYSNTVQIRVYATEHGNVGGSGISLGRGKVVTACHVVSDEGRAIIAVKQSGKKAGCRVVRKDSSRDLALLQCDGFSGDNSIRLVGAGKVVVGTPVVAVGSPSILPIVMTAGIVSGTYPEKGKYIIDAMIGPGSSGGPVFTSKGELVGIVQAILMMPPFAGFTTSPLQLRRFLDE